MNVERLRRSLLFVPASEPHRVAEGAACEADGLILDLEDTVARGAKPRKRLWTTLIRLPRESMTTNPVVSPEGSPHA